MTTYAGVKAVFQIMSGATSGNVNGGGFNPANANFIANWTATNANTSSPVVSSTSYNFAASDVGAWFYVKSGTNWTPGWYQIASVNTGVSPATATLSAGIGAAVQITGSITYSTNTVAGCATTASPTSGNCGVDYSQQTTAQQSWSNLSSTSSSTTLTDSSSGGLFTKVMAGNFICLASGTNSAPGWFEIVSVTDTNNVVTDRTTNTGTALASGVGKCGGAVSLGGSTTGITDAIFFALGTSGGAATTGNRWFIKGHGGASYTLSASVTGLAGSSTWPTIIEGYNLILGDRPTIQSGNQPILNMGSANLFTLAQWFSVFTLTATGSNTSVMVGGAGENLFLGCKFINTSTTANRSALDLSGSAFCQVIGCEAISYRGYGFNFSDGAGTWAIGCYGHDSSINYRSGGANTIINCISSGGTTYDIYLGAGSSNLVYGCTLYGGGTNQGTGIGIPANSVIMNNIFANLNNAYAGATTDAVNYLDYNNYYNVTSEFASSTAYPTDKHSFAVNPGFTLGNVAGTTATSSSTTLTDSGKNFTTAGVVAGRDFLHVLSGTGATVGVYGIASVGTTTLTTDLTIGTSSGGNLTYYITTGANFAANTNINSIGFPQLFPAGYTQGYGSIGAVPNKVNTTPIFQSGIIQGLGAI